MKTKHKIIYKDCLLKKYFELSLKQNKVDKK